MNDNPVVLSQTYFHLHISENTPVGTELIFINATDKDIGINGKVKSISKTFIFLFYYNRFIIQSVMDIHWIIFVLEIQLECMNLMSYEIISFFFVFRLTLVSPLDYESEQSYRLTIQVRDLGENSLARFVTIDISILDENDNSPQAFVTFVNPLLNNSIISILENTPIGQILAHISISDQDSGLNGEMSYRIEQGHEIIGIKILDRRSFLLVINHLIDREDKSIKIENLSLIIFDHGKPEKSIELNYQIHIIDLNDSPPKFNQSIKCNLDLNHLQNRSLDQPLFQIQAIDLDLEENGLISYSILPPYENSFIIDQQGRIFNFENLNESSYHLQIMAIDHGKPIRLNSTYDCYISISTNDHLENFNQPIKIIIFKYNYLLLLILILFLMIIGLIFCFYKFLFNQRRYFKPNKTYHLYVSIPRK